jgi:hypothetical protein
MRSTLGTKLAFPPINHQTPIYLYLHLRNLIFLTFLKNPTNGLFILKHSPSNKEAIKPVATAILD